MFNWIENRSKVLGAKEELDAIDKLMQDVPCPKAYNTKGEFIQKFLKSVDACIVTEYGGLPVQVRFDLSVIGSIYDLQQQIAELQEKIDAEYTESKK